MNTNEQRILLSELLKNPPSDEVLAEMIPDPAHPERPYIRREPLQALNLRCKGYSISEAAQQLSVPNGRISAWTLSALRSLRNRVPTNLVVDVLAVRRWLGMTVNVASKYGTMSALLEADPNDEELREEFIALGLIDGLTVHGYPNNRDLCMVRAKAEGKTHVQIGEEFGTTAKKVRTRLVRAYWRFQRDLRLEMDISAIFPQQRSEANSEYALLQSEENAGDKKQKHFTLEERKLIKNLLDSGQKGYQIAERLGRNNTSIYYEIRKGTHNGVYDPEYSHALYRKALSKKGVVPILSKNRKLACYIADRMLEDELSPEQIVDLLQSKNDPELPPVTRNTIYSAIDKGLIPGVTREILNHDVTKIYSRGCIMLPSWVRKKYGYTDGTMLQIVDRGNGEILLKPLVGECEEQKAEPRKSDE